jgi:hypothetical protein
VGIHIGASALSAHSVLLSEFQKLNRSDPAESVPEEQSERIGL